MCGSYRAEHAPETPEKWWARREREAKTLARRLAEKAKRDVPMQPQGQALPALVVVETEAQA